MTEQPRPTPTITRNPSEFSVAEQEQDITNESKSNLTRNVHVLETYNNREKSQEGGNTNRTRENARVETMIEARKKQKANLSITSKSSGKTMNNTREPSRNMVYEYNRSQIVAKEESFHKNMEE
jgi:hypothetical protein